MFLSFVIYKYFFFAISAGDLLNYFYFVMYR
jgi:hypothetical protein